MLRAGQLLPPKGAFDAALRRRAFPPDAGSLLPGLLAATRTGLTPAGGHELAHGHLTTRHPLMMIMPALLGTLTRH